MHAAREAVPIEEMRRRCDVSCCDVTCWQQLRMWRHRREDGEEQRHCRFLGNEPRQRRKPSRWDGMRQSHLIDRRRGF